MPLFAVKTLQVGHNNSEANILYHMSKQFWVLKEALLISGSRGRGGTKLAVQPGSVSLRAEGKSSFSAVAMQAAAEHMGHGQNFL